MQSKQEHAEMCRSMLLAEVQNLRDSARRAAALGNPLEAVALDRRADRLLASTQETPHEQ